MVRIALTLTTSSILNAAGAFAFVLVGAFAFFVARGSRRALTFGLASVALGGPLVLGNLLLDPREVSGPGLVAYGIVTWLAAAAIIPFAWGLVADLPPAWRRRFHLAAFLLGATFAVGWVFAHRDRADLAALIARPALASALVFQNMALNALGAALLLVVAGAALRVRALPDAPPEERRAIALAAAGFGAYPMFYLAPIHDFYDSLAWPWLGYVAVSLLWTGAGPSRDARPAMWVSLALHAAALAGLIFFGPLVATVNPGAEDYGIPGVIRTLAAFLLLLAILRYGLLGVQLPKASVRRGPLAGTAFAALLIVAQLAENFLETQYGLILGSVVAGALLVAARPIERALEARGAGAPSAGRDREEAYRNALRFALRDRRITREEELQLHRIAEQMGLSGRRAHELLVEVEAEGRAP